jgi:hypothetical protein
VATEQGENKNQVGGGFVLPRCWQLFAAFWCYRQGHLPLRAVRVWLALWEMQARRGRLGPKRRPKLRSAELLRLIGGGGEARSVRSDLRRLRTLGLASFEGGHILFPDTTEQLGDAVREQVRERLAEVPNANRRVPLPRRVVRFLAGAGTRALLATTLGEAMRLLYYKGGVVSGRGRSKASWLAKTFGVDLRNVKRARAHLEQLGLIHAPAAAPGYERVLDRRWGRVAFWNLDWSGAAPCTGLPPVDAKSDIGTPPVESNNTLPSEKKDQNPGLPGPAAGFSKKEQAEEPASIRNILEADLGSDPRTQELFEDAVKLSLIEHSEASRLRFFSLVEHARRYGTKNRPGLLRALLTKKRWFITQDDEDLARQRIKRLEVGQEAPKEARGQASEGEGLGSVLERILAQARPMAGQQGGGRDATHGSFFSVRNCG